VLERHARERNGSAADRPDRAQSASLHQRPTQRDIICTLVKRIEVADDVVRVVFRVDPGPSVRPGRGAFCHIVQLVVILHRMLRDGGEFRWSAREAQPA
jgi:hypothetical protein